MTVPEIETVISQFARAARVVADAGFDGVEIHAAHGYLLSQFLSAKVNKREDGYGGDARGRARLVAEVVRAVREETKGKEGFCVGVKVNSVDFQGEGDRELREWVEQVGVMVEAGVDFVEVSGGSFEDPKVGAPFFFLFLSSFCFPSSLLRLWRWLTIQMMTGNGEPEDDEEKSDRTKAREAFFLEFARAIRNEFPNVPLMVTGGFSSRRGMEQAVADGDCDLIGLGRPAILNPSAPNNVIFNHEVQDQDAVLYRKKNKTPWLMKQLGLGVIGAGIDSVCLLARLEVRNPH